MSAKKQPPKFSKAFERLARFIEENEGKENEN